MAQDQAQDASGGSVTLDPLTLEIVNAKGLHARAAAKFAALAASFDAQVTLCREGMEACGSSIMGLMMLAAAQGTRVVLIAKGPQAAAAQDALAALIRDRFGEDN